MEQQRQRRPGRLRSYALGAFRTPANGPGHTAGSVLIYLLAAKRKAHFFQAQPLPPLYGANRDSEGGCDLWVTHAAEVAQLDGTSLALRQVVEKAADLGAVTFRFDMVPPRVSRIKIRPPS